LRASASLHTQLDGHHHLDSCISLAFRAYVDSNTTGWRCQHKCITRSPITVKFFLQISFIRSVSWGYFLEAVQTPSESDNLKHPHNSVTTSRLQNINCRRCTCGVVDHASPVQPSNEAPGCPGSCIFQLCRQWSFELPRSSHPSAVPALEVSGCPAPSRLLHRLR
jgi:hypothetical protein